MSKYVLVIDRGSTNVKAVVFDQKGNDILCCSHANPKPAAVEAGWWEQDMAIMWDATVKAIKKVFATGTVTPSDIMGVFVTGQGNGLMLVDKKGSPLRNGILSLDSRATEIYDEWNQTGVYMQAAQVVGMPFPVGSPLPLLMWFKRNQPEVYAAIGSILFSKDWIRYKLSGTLCTDQTDASGAGLMAIAQNEYAWDIFTLLGFGEELRGMLPEIHPAHEVVGKISRQASLETGLSEGTPVLCGAHDIAAYPFGVGTLDSKELVTVVGTWGMNLIATQSLEGAMAGLYHTVPGYFVTGLGDGNSGGCLDIIVNSMCMYEKYQAEQLQKSVYEIIEESIASSKPSGIVFHPYIFGSLLNSAATAGFYGIKNWHAKADLMRAVYEGIVMGHYTYVNGIPGHENIQSMWLIGGGAKSKIFGQLFADMANVPVKIAATEEITARGGAMNALVGLGVYKTHQQACIPPEIKKTYLPDAASHEFLMKKFGIFHQISQVNEDIWNQLDKMSR